MSTAVVLKSLIQESKDGEWGKGEPFEDSVKMAVIRGTDFEAVRNGNIDALPIRYIPKRIADRKTLQPNDILLETAGGSKDRPTGRSLFIRSSIIHRSELPLTCASFSRFIRIDPTKADPRYIFWHLQYLYDADYLRPYHTQHTGVARFQYTVFSEREELVIPPLPIQRKIAGILSAYDDLIENNTRRIEILEEMARSIYREWFVKFRFPGHEQVQMLDSELGLIPEGWEVKNLGNLTSVITKGTTPTTLGQKYTSEGINFIKVESIDSSGSILDNKLAKIDKETHILLKRSQLKTGDILFSIAGAIGRSTIISENILPANTNQALAIIRPIEPLLVLYLYRVIQSREFVNFSLGRVVQTAQANVSLSVLSAAPILVPERLTLEKFRDISQPIVKAVDLVQQKNFNLRQTRDLLLPRLISGEIDVENLDINTGPIAA
jgi:type I restriction enzyme S subunit